MGHADRLARGARRAPARPLAPRRRALEPLRPRADATTRPSTSCCARCAASTASSTSRSTASPRSTTAATRGTLAHVGDGTATPSATPTATTCRCACAPTCGSGSRARAPARADRMRAGQTRVLRARLERARAAARPTTTRATGSPRPRDLLARLDQPRPLPRPPLADPPAALRADAQGPDLRADRRDDRRGDDLAARDARRRAQLGLPLQLAARLDVHALGALHARLRPRGDATSSTSSPTGVEDEDLQIMYGIDGRARARRGRPSITSRGYEGARPVRVGNDAWHHSQHDVWGVLLDSVRLHTRSGDRLDDRLWPLIARQVDDGARALARARPRHLGGARRAAALHLLEGLLLGRRRPRRAARAPARATTTAAERWEAAADEIHAEICEQRHRRPRRVRAALRHGRARRLAAADPARRLPARRPTSACARRCSRSPTS